MNGTLESNNREKLYNKVLESGLFDSEFYLMANQDVAQINVNPIFHYIDYGQYEENRKPYPEFDADQYISDFGLPDIGGNVFWDLLERNCYTKKYDTEKLTPNEIYIYNLIEKSNLFDEDYYVAENSDLEPTLMRPLVHYVKYGIFELKRNPNRKFNNMKYYNHFKDDISENEAPIIHYIRNNLHLDFFDKGLLSEFSYEILSTSMNRLKSFPLYSDEDYINLNSDVKNSDLLPYQHALVYGIPEGRNIFSKLRIAKTLGSTSKIFPKYEVKYRIKKSEITNADIGVFYHTQGNCFIKEIAEDMVTYLKESGFEASLKTEKSTVETKPALCIFCAPHEFFFLEGSKHWKDENILKNSLMLNTEQSQTAWFTRGFLYLLMSAGVIDFLYQNIKIFESVGIPSFHFDPIPNSSPTKILERDRSHGFFRLLPEAAKLSRDEDRQRKISERTIDISFFGNSSLKREKFFSRNAELLSQRECFLYYRKPHGPIKMEGANEILSRMPLYVAENSKICLNVHRNDDPYFEWHRIIKQGAARGAVVVSEECLPTPLYKEGTHYLAETPRHMPHLISWLLDTENGQIKMQEIQNSCLSLFSNNKIKKSKQIDIHNFIKNILKGIE